VYPYADFQGTKTELFFLKVSGFMSRNRFKVFIGIIAFATILSAIAGFGEVMRYRENKATILAEQLELKFDKNPSLTVDAKIQEMEIFLKEHSAKNTTLRISKRLADAYTEKKDFSKSAILLEKIANTIEEPKEMKAYYFYLAGNARDNAKEPKVALDHFAKANSFLTNNRETPTFQAWTLYSMARMKYQEGQLDSAKADLKKILDIEEKYPGPYLNEVKQLATYLILKINKG
jgi:tetratricopeptide (TPR) repeat protein